MPTRRNYRGHSAGTGGSICRRFTRKIGLRRRAACALRWRSRDPSQCWPYWERGSAVFCQDDLSAPSPGDPAHVLAGASSPAASGWGVPKSPAVVLVVTITFIVVLGIGALVAQQVTHLGQKLPEYQFNIEGKISSLRGVASGGALERISRFLSDINQEIRKQDKNQAQSATAATQRGASQADSGGGPPARSDANGGHQRVLQPLVDPLTTAGLVAIFVIFFLLQRQDLIDRLIRLAGSHDLHRTTQAINDGAQPAEPLLPGANLTQRSVWNHRR